MGKRILLVGGGGHCRSVLDSILELGEYEKIGIVDKENVSILGIQTVGVDENLPKLFAEGWTDAVVTVGSIGNTDTRRRLFEKIKQIGFALPAIIDKSAVIGLNVSIGMGSFVGKKAVVNAGSHLGDCVIINTGAIVEHDCRIGDFSHISSGAVLCGNVFIGNDTHIGAGSTVRQLICVGNNTIIGVGSIVVEDIPSNKKAYGNPCKVVE